MRNVAATRYRFIAHALAADGPFRPQTTRGIDGTTTLSGSTYLVAYPRESDEKFARRNELSWFESPLARVTSRFVGYITEKPNKREVPNPLFAAMVQDVDGRGNNIDVFWSEFMVNAKARGSFLMLIDMPRQLPLNLAAQIAQRAAPVWTQIDPADVTEYRIDDRGQFSSVSFSGQYAANDGEDGMPCTWHFDRSGWRAEDANKKTLTEGQHSLGVCPVLLFTEGTRFPHFGPFSAIADLSKRLFNLESELDEILRAQTFSLLTMQVPQGSDETAMKEAARTVGATISTQNLMMHTGATPAFIAPPDGPAKIYIDRIAAVRQQIDEIGLVVSQSNQRESGIAMQMRFHSLNGELARFASRIEDFERRAWDLSARWLSMSVAPQVSWPRQFDVANIDGELTILSEMNANAMPRRVIVEQQHRIVGLQFPGADDEDKAEMASAIDEQIQERTTGGQPPPSGDPQ